MAGVVDVPTVECAVPVANQKAPVLTLEACYNVQELKRGRYSVIFHGECDVVGAPVVIKTYDRPSLVPKKQKMATREAIVLKYLKAQGVPNITHVWSAYASQDRFHIIMEYCQGGNLLEHLKATAAPVPEQQLAAMIAAPLLRTLAAMHAVGVTHRDIKLENIFLDNQGHPKLGDFDLAVFHHEAPARAPVGTIFYMAPEVLLLASYKGSALEGAMQARVSDKMDVWSLGVCLFELAAGYKPFQGVSYEGIASAVLQHAMADLPNHLSSAFKSFMAAALTYDPAQRPSAAQLLDHPWIQVHCPAALRSDSAGSLMDVHNSNNPKSQQQQQHSQQHQQQQMHNLSMKPAAGKQQQQQAATPAAHSQPWQQQQNGSSACGGSSGCCEPLTPSSCSSNGIAGGSSGSSSSSALKCSRDLHYGGGVVGLPAAVAAGGMHAAAAAAVWGPHAQPFADSAHQQQQHAGLAPMVAHAGLPGIRVRSSLGTAHDWSTHDSSAACSPHSMLLRMGFSSSSGTLARQLMPWASERSSALGLGYNMSYSTVHGCNAHTGLHSSYSGGSGCIANSQQQQQQQNGSSVTQQQQQELGRKAGSSSGGGSGISSSSNVAPMDGDNPRPASTSSRHMRSSSASSSSSTGAAGAAAAGATAQLQQQQQQPVGHRHTRSASGGSSSRGSSQPPAASEAAAAPAAATAAAAAAGSQHLSPLALAVAAAVAEHNKRQPRMWTPFALRVHQMRVAQVLLAERQRQVATNQPNPPPPVQPLVPQQGEPVVLPDQDAAATAARQQQQQGLPGQAAAQMEQQQQQHGMIPRVDQGSRDRDSNLYQQQQPVAAVDQAPSPAGASDAMIRPLVHQMQQQLSLGGTPTAAAASTSSSSSPGSSRAAAGSSGSSSAHKPPKQAKKKGFLSCFVPRAFE